MTLTGRVLLIAICACAAMAVGQDTIRPTRPEVQSFIVMTKQDFEAKFAAWITYSIMHSPKDRLRTEWAASQPAGAIHIFQCGPTAGQQQEMVKEFARYADLFSYTAFRYPSNDKPAERELFWGNFTNPLINHARQMRKLAGATPIVAHLESSLGEPGARRLPVTLEEMQWQFIAALGCGHRGVVWSIPYEGVAWGNELKLIEDRIRKYARFLGQGQPVDWAKAPKDQPVSAIACDGYLFVFLLNTAYMAFGSDGKMKPAPLDKPVCEGSVSVILPASLEIRRGQALLGGGSLRLTTENGKTTARYSFRTGGEALVFMLSGRPDSATRPASTSAVDH